MSKNFQRDSINPAPLDIATLTLVKIFDGVVPEMLIDDDAEQAFGASQGNEVW